jgi:Flp pilus assembly protein TadB
MRSAVKNTPDDDRLQRSRQARQVIAGSDVRPPSSPSYGSSYAAPSAGMFSPAQRNYLIAVAVLLVLGLLLYLVFSFGVASIIFFLLAMALLAGWVVF